MTWLPLVLALAGCAAPGPRAESIPDSPASANADENTYPDPLDLAATHVEAIGGRARVEAIRGYHSRRKV